MREITNSDFETILKSDKPVLIKFSAPWCAPCKAFAPIFDEYSKERSDIEFVEANIEDNDLLASYFTVTKVPMLALIQGDGVAKYAGPFLPSAFRKWVEENVS